MHFFAKEKNSLESLNYMLVLEIVVYSNLLMGGVSRSSNGMTTTSEMRKKSFVHIFTMWFGGEAHFFLANFDQ